MQADHLVDGVNSDGDEDGEAIELQKGEVGFDRAILLEITGYVSASPIVDEGFLLDIAAGADEAVGVLIAGFRALRM